MELNKCESFRIFISEYSEESDGEEEDLVERISNIHMFKGEQVVELELKNGEKTFIRKANMRKLFPQVLLNYYE